ncbi:class B sortase [Clostridium sardiniense]|uniref:Class B sortase n=1 Tax=Clostridium sardiniense TaxID=29369 RepID=A0ABS7KSZ5_CLOSR|nr:class B sortase [Clostridium sardiniense]MBY0753924.1 class B sortase [Clostridium sardiniense]MDQ0459561.1 sortase B [Clostridium sardiniense]
MKKAINTLLLIAIIFSLYKVVTKINDYNKSKNTYEKIQDVKSNSNDFSKELMKINEDYKMWIEVPNTNINYPVVQGKDNDFYLNHDFNRKESSSGAIFIDYKNDIDKDKNIVIYGHNMKNKSMFQNLMKFKDEEFWKNNNKIILTIDGKKYEYEIFSAYVNNVNNVEFKFDFRNDDEYLKYLQEIKEKSIFSRDTDIISNERIVTLSTCSYENDDARMIIHGRFKR